MTFDRLRDALLSGYCIKCRTRRERYEVLKFLQAHGLVIALPLSYYHPDNAGREGLFHPYIGFDLKRIGIYCYYTAGTVTAVIPYKEVKVLIQDEKKADYDEFEKAFSWLIGETAV